MKSTKILILLVLLETFSLSFVAIAQDLSVDPPVAKGPAKLESVLYQLTQADNYNEFAKARGLYVKDDKVRVIIELNSTDYKLRPEFGTEESRYTNLLQAVIRIDKLIVLANEPNVQYIRTPAEAAPASTQVITPSENLPAEKTTPPDSTQLPVENTGEIPVTTYILGGIVTMIVLFGGYLLLKRRGGIV